MVENLQIGPYLLTIMPLYSGPLPEVQAGAATEALATLLSHAIDLPESGLAAAIEAGQEGSDPIAYVTPATDAEDDLALREAWAKLTGEQLGPGAVARVGVAGRYDTLAVSWEALRAGLAKLRSIRAAWRPDPGPWLFTRPTKSPFITPQDYELIKRLEEEAAAIDELDIQVEVGQEPIALITRRRALLRECQDAGIFANDHDQARESWLNYWFAERLLALRRATLQLHSWGFLAEDEEPLDGPVCLDYARHGLWPPGEDGQEWARAALRLLSPLLEGEQGVILERVGGITTRIWWRRDGARPAFLAIARGLDQSQ